MKPSPPPAPLTVLCLFVAAIAQQGGASVECEDTFADPATGDETTVSVRIDEPLPGTEIRAWAPDCPQVVQVAGVASTVGLDPHFDIYEILDESGSTRACSGADIDGDGIIGISGPFSNCSDPDDSILHAEVKAARLFLRSLEPGLSRVALISFSDERFIQTRQTLTDDFDLVEAALDSMLLGTALGATDYGAALRELIDEHDRAHEAFRIQVALFLSDGRPTAPTPPFFTRDGDDDCVGGLDVCAGLMAADSCAARDIVVHTFGVGADADAEVLQKIADRTGGEFFPVAIPGDIVDVIDDVLLVHITEIRVENRTTGEVVIAEPTPEGRFRAPLALVPGRNDLAVVAVADAPPGSEVECFTDVTLSCLVPTCPPDQVHECDGSGRANVTGLVATANDALVVITNDSPHDTSPLPGDHDASGSYPLGTTVVGFTFTDAVAGVRGCTAAVTVEDTLPPVLLGAASDVTVECVEPPPSPPTVQDVCDAMPVLSFEEVRVPGPCPDAAVITRTWTATDASGNSAVHQQVVTVVDRTPPVPFALMVPRDPLPPASAASPASPASAAPPASPASPRSPASPASACSSPSSRFFEIRCGATDNCDPAPAVSAALIVTRHVVQGPGLPCLLQVDAVPVTCGEVLEVRLAAPPCGPSSARSVIAPVAPVEVTSTGVRVVTGESVVLEVTATDRCGNVGAASFDPTTDPPDPCEDHLADGTCCPALAPPRRACRFATCN